MSISIFLDDLRQTPKGFERTYTVPETIELIQDCQEKHTAKRKATRYWTGWKNSSLRMKAFSCRIKLSFTLITLRRGNGWKW